MFSEHDGVVHTRIAEVQMTCGGMTRLEGLRRTAGIRRETPLQQVILAERINGITLEHPEPT